MTDTDQDHWYNPKIIQDTSKGVKTKLLIITSLCIIFMLVEAIGAYISNSIAIFTDVVHLFSDLLGFVFSLASIYLSSKKANDKHSYGYIWAEILGALTSVVIIWGMTIWIIFRAFERLYIMYQGNLIVLDSWIMIGTSIIGVCVNLIMAFSLHG